MALPTSSLSLSQVNTALGYTSTATIPLADPMVKSLAGTDGPSVSMSQLLGKSLAWISRTLTNVAASNYPPILCSVPGQGTYTLRAASITNEYAILQKLFLDGTVNTQVKLSDVNTLKPAAAGAIFQTSDASIFIVAYMEPTSTRCHIVKFNSFLQYQSALRYADARSPGDLKYGTDGSFVVAEVVFGYYDYYYISKYTSGGAGVWSYFANVNNENSIALDTLNNVYVANNAWDTYGGAGFPTLTKISSAGSVLWARAVDGFDYRGVFISGANQVTAYGAATRDGFNSLVTYDLSGNFQWAGKLNIGFSPGSYSPPVFNDDSAVLGPDGFLYLVARSFITGINPNPSYYVASIVKVSSAGILQWVRSFEFLSGSGYELSIGAGISVANGVVNFSISSTAFFSVSVPTDGSGTGTYNVGGIQMRYFIPATASLSSFTPEVSSDSSAMTPIGAPAALVASSSVVVSSITNSTTVVYI